MNMKELFLILLSIVLCAVLTPFCYSDKASGSEEWQMGNLIFSNENSVFVKDFGAFANDQKSDTEQITKAIQYADSHNKKYVVLDKGVYNLKGDKDSAPTIFIDGVNNITLIGQVAEDGQPATVLELNVPLANEMDVVFSRHIDCKGSDNIGIENIIFDINPRFSTSGKVVSVDTLNKRVEVEIFEGMSHFDGMKCYSANAWDLETKTLLHIDPLTIYMESPYFINVWKRVDQSDKAIYAIRNMPFYNKVSVGDGISWHYAAKTTKGMTMVFDDCKDLKLKNLHIYNSITVGIKVYDTRNISMIKVSFIPEGNSLAVGPRDGIHLSNPRGVLFADSLYIKGVRWDPFVSRVNFVTVTELLDSTSIVTSYVAKGNPQTIFQKGDQVVFWCGDTSVKCEVSSVEVLSEAGEKKHLLRFKESLPEQIRPGTLCSPPTWDKASITNSVFEDNFGTCLVYENENLMVENNIFRNNAYHAIGLGPTSKNTGAFAENLIIRNNHFISCGWINKYGGVSGGGITTFENHEAFSKESYNMNILIEKNIFENMSFREDMGAIGLSNAQNVTIRNNTFKNVKNKLVIDKMSTQNIFFFD